MTSRDAYAKSLTYIKGYYLSEVISSLLRSSVLYQFTTPRPPRDVAASLALDPEVLTAILRFLATENIVVFKGNNVRLTQYGRTLLTHRGWYDLLIGGYSPTLQKVSTIMARGKKASIRNETFVALGSGAIDEYDVVPLITSMLRKRRICPKIVVDLGCGSGSCLVGICRKLPTVRAIGVVGSRKLARLSSAVVRSAGMSGRITIATSNVADYSKRGAPDLFLCAFVLQELVYQRGRDGLVTFLQRLARTYPKSWLFVVEVPAPDPRADSSPATLGPYYSCYFLVHSLTRQQLLTTKQWDDVFRRSGYTIVDKGLTGHQFDPSASEVGYLLRPQSQKQPALSSLKAR